MNLLRGPHGSRREAVSTRGCRGDVSEVRILSSQGFGEKAVLVLSGSEAGGWEESGNVGLESRSQIWEETGRVQEPVQLAGRSQASGPNRSGVWYPHRRATDTAPPLPPERVTVRHESAFFFNHLLLFFSFVSFLIITFIMLR